jgi:hypothetical protein
MALALSAVLPSCATPSEDEIEVERITTHAEGNGAPVEPTPTPSSNEHRKALKRAELSRTYAAHARPTIFDLPRPVYAELEQGDLATADDLVRDVWEVRGHPSVTLPFPPTFKENPYDDAYFRFVFYSLRPTSHLLFAYKTTGEKRYLDKLVALLRAYVTFDETRGYDRRTFDNEHATAYRGMVLSNLYVGLRTLGVLPADLATSLPEAVTRIGTFLLDPKRFEDWANHGFAEAAALVSIARTFPRTREASTFRTTGLARLDHMLETNLDEDGVDIENSPFYHLFVLGLVGQIGAWLADYEPTRAAPWLDAATRMTHYLAYVTQPNGRLPWLGATGATLIRTQDPAVYEGLFSRDPELLWHWSGGTKGVRPSRALELFPSSGLFVLRAPEPGVGRDLAQTWVSFDAGVYRTDHSHLDALSVTLYGEGTTLFPDGGLYTYDAGEPYSYFHGTRSHNTVLVDGQDQREGAALAGASGSFANGAWATGKSSLAADVRHARTVMVLDQGAVLVTDTLTAPTAHVYEQLWHTYPGAGLAFEGASATLTNAAGGKLAVVRQARPDGLESRDAFGETSPRQGFVSSAYGSMDPVHTAIYRRTGTSAFYATLVLTGDRARSSVPVVLDEIGEPTRGHRRLRVDASGIHTFVDIDDEGEGAARVILAN